jgi:hypothetical protein
MKRLVGAAALGALLTTSALAGGSMESPSDKKAPKANKSDTDNPPNAGKSAATKPADNGPALPGASEGSSPGTSGSSSNETNADVSKDKSK